MSVRMGVIGVGHLGQHHARVYSQRPDASLVGVMDSDADRAASIVRQYGGESFVHIDHLLEHVQAVSVAVPTSFHFPVVRQCLEAGVHVLVEKPIAMMSCEGRALDVLAKQKRLILQVGHIERFNPVWEGVLSSIREPFFFQAQRLSPFPDRGTDVDVVRDLMIHDLDILLSFDLGLIQSVEAVGLAIVSPHIDVAHARIQFHEGCVATLIANRISGERVRTLSLLQNDALIELDYHTRRSLTYRRERQPFEQHTSMREERYGSDHEPLQLELDAFLASVREGTKPLVSGEEASACLELAERIVESLCASDTGNAYPGLPSGSSTCC